MVKEIKIFALHPSNISSNTYTEMIDSIYRDVSDGPAYVTSGCYLPSGFDSTGVYKVAAALFDHEAQTGHVPEHFSETVDLTFDHHGYPVAPFLRDVSIFGSGATADVFSYQTPHQLGFYSNNDITYYLEANQNEDATSGWIRSSGIQNPSTNEAIQLDLPSSGYWYFRVFAVNPLGSGTPSANPALAERDFSQFGALLVTASGQNLVTASGTLLRTT